MREKINKLAQGSIDDSTPVICVEPKTIRYELRPDEPAKLQLVLSSGNGVLIKGLAYSSDMRVKILNPSFGGSNVRVILEVTLRSTDIKTSFSGSIDFVTNGGEFTVPFVFDRKADVEDHELSGLRSSEDFAAMAEENKENALRVFGLENFTSAPFMNNTRYKTLYRAFKKCPDREIAMEQFIAACGIKISNYSSESAEFSLQSGIPHKRTASYTERSKPSDTYKRHYYEYSRLRLAYDMDRGNKSELLEEMLWHLDDIIVSPYADEFIILHKAEVLFLLGNIRETLVLMNSVATVIRDNRQEKIHEYFMLEYLEIIVNHRDKGSFLRLCRKFMEERHFTDLFIYIIRLDDELVNNDVQFRNFLTEAFSYGVRSPWLYYYYCMLLNDHPEYLYAPKPIDSHSLNFGRKYHAISENISQAVISASCAAYIKSDRRHISAHKTYCEGVKLGISINGLFEYYLYSLPKDPDYVISDDVFNHYRDGDKLDNNTKTRLYANLVRNKKKNTSLFKSYEERITAFAVAQLREHNINDYLADIYVSVLKPEMIDQDLSETFCKLVNCYRIRTANPKLRSVVITYEQTANERVYTADHGNAILPIYFADEIILFQDTYGNRYFDVPYTRELLFTQNSYRSAAERLAPMYPGVRLKRINELLSKKNLSSEDVLYLENEVYEKELNDGAKSILISRLIQYYNQHAATGYNPNFLLKINMLSLSVSEREDLCNAYITCGCFRQAYDMICAFGCEGVSDRNIRILCSNLVCDDQLRDQKVLMYLCEMTAARNLQDNVILDYLCDIYNGPTESMYGILKKAIASHIDTHDMEERLIAQLIFIGETDIIDTVFEWYVSRRKASESIVKAYFTLKSASFFFDDEEIDDRIFGYIENAVKDTPDTGTVPLIYVLALTKYYSKLDALNDLRTAVAKRLVYYLIDEKYTLEYLKDFDRYFSLPDEFMCEKIISYRTSPGKTIVFRSCISPAEDSFMPETPSSSFMNVFIKTKVLFAGETWYYEAYETDGSQRTLIDKGSIVCNDVSSDIRKTKYHELNNICLSSLSDNDSGVTAMMKNYAAKERAINKLFGV